MQVFWSSTTKTKQGESCKINRSKARMTTQHRGYPCVGQISFCFMVYDSQQERRDPHTHWWVSRVHKLKNQPLVQMPLKLSRDKFLHWFAQRREWHHQQYSSNSCLFSSLQLEDNIYKMTLVTTHCEAIYGILTQLGSAFRRSNYIRKHNLMLRRTIVRCYW